MYAIRKSCRKPRHDLSQSIILVSRNCIIFVIIVIVTVLNMFRVISNRCLEIARNINSSFGCRESRMRRRVASAADRQQDEVVRTQISQPLLRRKSRWLAGVSTTRSVNDRHSRRRFSVFYDRPRVVSSCFEGKP